MGHFRKKMITIFMTNQCNMRCKYCYLGDSENVKESIDLKFAKRAIQDYFISNPEPAVRFFANGEPTLEFEKMIEIYDFSCSICEKKPLFELQTNGFFGISEAEWIKNNIDIVFVSIDGPPQINDINRITGAGVGITDVVERNIKSLVAETNCTVGVRSTITKHNVKKQIELIDYFKSIGVNIVFGDMVFANVGGGLEDFGVDYITFVDEFVEAKKHAESIGTFYGTMFSSNFDECVEYACRSCIPTPHLTTDGCVTCCDMCVSANSSLKEMIYGRYDPLADVVVYDEKAIEKIRSRTGINIPACKACEVRDYCAGACFGEALNETGDFFGVKLDSCRAILYLWEKLGKTEIKNPYLHP